MNNPNIRCLQLMKKQNFFVFNKHFQNFRGKAAIISTVGFTLSQCAVVRKCRSKNNEVYEISAGQPDAAATYLQRIPKLDIYAIILAFNWCVFAANLAAPQLFSMGVKANIMINQGEWWRLFTAMFLHVDLVHCAVNSYSLNSLGPIVEKVGGQPRFIVVYLCAGFVGNLASYMFSPNAISAGASGAIFGLGGALAVFCLRHRDILGSSADIMLRQLRDNLVINVIFGLLNRRIDNWGHIGGLVGGALAAYLVGPNVVKVPVEGKRNKYKLQDQPPIRLLATKPK